MAKLSWYKGNIHTHTTESDGDADPEKVVSWFRRHGYDFLVLSDHNHLTIFEYGAGRRRFKRPLLVPGEEVSANIKGGTVPIHINGIGLSRVVEPIDAGEIVPTIQANVNAIRQAGGISSINHPNYKWAFDHTHLRLIEGLNMLEVFNGHPAANVYGGPGKFSYDEIWDGVLSAGVVVFGVATDDSHNYHDFSPQKSNPGRGWVAVRAAELSQDAIVDGLATGEFYASSGVDPQGPGGIRGWHPAGGRTGALPPLHDQVHGQGRQCCWRRWMARRLSTCPQATRVMLGQSSPARAT